MKVRVDGRLWFAGKASCLLVGNIGKLTGGLEVFEHASPSDGMLNVGVVTAKSTWQWVRVFSRLAGGHVERSPFVKTTRGKRITIEMERKAAYELDGGARSPVKRLDVHIDGSALTVCAPPAIPRRRGSAPRQDVGHAIG